MGNYLSGVETVYFYYFFEGYMMSLCDAIDFDNLNITNSTLT